MARNDADPGFEVVLEAALADLRCVLLSAHVDAHARRPAEEQVGSANLRPPVLRVALHVVSASGSDVPGAAFASREPERRPAEPDAEVSDRLALGNPSLRTWPAVRRAISPVEEASALLEKEDPPQPPVVFAARRPTPAESPGACDRAADRCSAYGVLMDTWPPSAGLDDTVVSDRAHDADGDSARAPSGETRASARRFPKCDSSAQPQAGSRDPPASSRAAPLKDHEVVNLSALAEPVVRPSGVFGNHTRRTSYDGDGDMSGMGTMLSTLPFNHKRNEPSKLRGVVQAALEGGARRQKGRKVKGFGNIISVGLLGNRNHRLSLILDVVLGVVITLNAAALGISLDLEPSWAGWNIVDACFAVIFLLEVLAKLKILGPQEYLGGESRWLHFYDVVMVIFSFVDLMLTLIQPSDDSAGFNVIALRVVRLGRVARLLRVLKLPFLSELMMMINGAIGGLRTLLCAQLLLAVPLYGLAVTFRQLLGPYSHMGMGAECFSSMGDSFLACFRCFIAGDCTAEDGTSIFVTLHVHYGAGFSVFYCVATVFMTFGLFNVIAAIFVDNILAAAKFNETRMQQHRLANQKLFAEKALQLIEIIYAEAMFEQSGTHGSLKCDSNTEELCTSLMKIRVSPELFHKIFSLQEFQEVLRELDISDEDHTDLFETLDIDGSGTIDLEELIRGEVEGGRKEKRYRQRRSRDAPYAGAPRRFG